MTVLAVLGVKTRQNLTLLPKNRGKKMEICLQNIKMKKRNHNKRNETIKLIIQKSEESFEFGDFIDSVINYKKGEDLGINKRPYKNDADFKGNSLE